MSVTKTIDARDTFCPGPLMELISYMKHASVGDTVELLSTDSGSANDIPEWVKKVGHEMVGTEQVEGVWHLKVRKANNRSGSNATDVLNRSNGETWIGGSNEDLSRWWRYGRHHHRQQPCAPPGAQKPAPARCASPCFRRLTATCTSLACFTLLSVRWPRTSCIAIRPVCSNPISISRRPGQAVQARQESGDHRSWQDP
jgi:tRNA 2-thiouridine synthesizing protein A